LKDEGFYVTNSDIDKDIGKDFQEKRIEELVKKCLEIDISTIQSKRRPPI